jgi:hypothetical protein
VAEWLRSGLQSRLHRFDSGRRLGKDPQIGTFLLGRCADYRLLSQNSPKKPSTGLDFCTHLQGICLASDSSIPVPRQKAVDGGHWAKDRRPDVVDGRVCFSSRATVLDESWRRPLSAEWALLRANSRLFRQVQTRPGSVEARERAALTRPVRLPPFGVLAWRIVAFQDGSSTPRRRRGIFWIQRLRARNARFFRRLPHTAISHQWPCWLRERS